ncbi:hypothetical protein CVD25_02605 [Bacillus canaveralius]|uniref:Uncharacterized protein n=1 Tax=Bacillus canaveralius TaxID=1403243 RepID=A0A2N5GHD6_9BACI|nr:hypothetical protein CU635_18805 [Bacillus canaveralius]PLS00450.1 hypothetical protein CVD25_02605 [Bacillus canaveralius]
MVKLKPQEIGAFILKTNSNEDKNSRENFSCAISIKMYCHLGIKVLYYYLLPVRRKATKQETTKKLLTFELKPDSIKKSP